MRRKRIKRRQKLRMFNRWISNKLNSLSVKLLVQVYTKEVVVPLGANSTPPSKHKTTAVELYFDPHGSISIVDVLVQEGVKMDYARPLPLLDGNSSLGEMSSQDQTVKKTIKTLLDLPTVPGSTLDSDDCIDTDHSLLDFDDSLLKPPTGSMDANETVMGNDSSRGVVSHVTSPKLLVGHWSMELASQTRTQFSNWQGFLKFCDDFL